MVDPITLPACVCQRCKHRWIPRIRDPVQCPKCKSARWRQVRQRPRKRNTSTSSTT